MQVYILFWVFVLGVLFSIVSYWIYKNYYKKYKNQSDYWAFFITSSGEKIPLLVSDNGVLDVSGRFLNGVLYTNALICKVRYNYFRSIFAIHCKDIDVSHNPLLTTLNVAVDCQIFRVCYEKDILVSNFYKEGSRLLNSD